jgi:hypothetical protein
VIEFLIFCAEYKYITHTYNKAPKCAGFSTLISLPALRLIRCSRLPVIKHTYSIFFA